MSHPNFSSAFHRLWDTAPNRRARRALGRNGSARRRARPSLETLEDRITPNATFTPTVFTDGVTGSGQVNTLRDAVLAANRDTSSGTDTIQLQAGTYTLSIVNSNGHETVGTEGDLNISNTNHTLVIQGIADVAGTPSTIIEQTAVDRVFQILAPGTTVIFKNVIIEGGQAQDEGGSGQAAFSSESDGGGILDEGGKVTLSNVILQNNSAEAANGFAAKGGGIFVAQGGSLTVSDSIIQKDGAFGGAGVKASPNGGEADGGGIYTLSPTTINNSTVSNNVVTGGGPVSSSSGAGGNALGGAIFASDHVTITNSALDDNTLTGGASGATVGGSAEGGSLFVATHGIAKLSSSLLVGNTLTGGLGAFGEVAIHQGNVGGNAEGGGVFSGGQLTVSGCGLSGNTLTGGKGFLQNGAATITGNIGGDALGGGVFAQGITNIFTSTLANNKLTGGAGADLEGSHNGFIGGSALGGGIDFSGTSAATATISACALTGNILQGGSNVNGPQFPGFASGGGAAFRGSTTNLINSTVANNEAIGGPSPGEDTTLVADGGGVNVGFGATAVLTNDTVAHNQAGPVGSGNGKGNGGGIANDGGTVTLKNTLVAINFGVGGSGDDVFGTVNSSSSHNLIGNADGSTGFSAANGNQLGSSSNLINPVLGQLANNGGPTQTLALLTGSPAINAGDNSAETVTGPFDQRGQGFPRIAQGHIDIGAFEFQVPPSPPPPPTPHSPPPAPQPSLFQAVISLYLDGIELAAVEKANTAAFQDNFALASLLGEVLGFFGNPNLNAINANIAFMEPFAGAFGPFVVQAGETALLNALPSS